MTIQQLKHLCDNPPEYATVTFTNDHIFYAGKHAHPKTGKTVYKAKY